ncbi:GL20006, partial [Drosophila persimilis]
LLFAGKSTSNSKEIICPDDKYKEEGDIWNVEAQTAFLGPNLWDKTLPYDADLKVTQVSIILHRCVVAASLSLSLSLFRTTTRQSTNQYTCTQTSTDIHRHTCTPHGQVQS